MTKRQFKNMLVKALQNEESYFANEFEETGMIYVEYQDGVWYVVVALNDDCEEYRYDFIPSGDEKATAESLIDIMWEENGSLLEDYQKISWSKYDEYTCG